MCRRHDVADILPETSLCPDMLIEREIPAIKGRWLKAEGRPRHADDAVAFSSFMPIADMFLCCYAIFIFLIVLTLSTSNPARFLVHPGTGVSQTLAA